MLLFKKKSPPLLGIDISSASVKVLELSKNGTRFHVERYAAKALPRGAVVDKNIANVEAVGDTIKSAVKQSGSRLKHAAVAVSGSSVITKIISMPASLSDRELEAQIELEADQYIPYSLDEVNLDFEVQGPNEKNPEMVDVLLAASRQENIDTRVAALESAGLTPRIVDVESYAMQTALSLLLEHLPEAEQDQTIVIADAGAMLTTVNVIQNDRVVYTREQGFGGEQLTEEIQRRYGLTYEEAGLAKKHGGLPDNYMSEVLEPFKQALAQQVARSLQFFFSSSTHRSVNYIVLAGGCAAIPGVDCLVEENMNTRTIVANPFLNMSVSNRIKPQDLRNDASTLLICCGLAMRGFD